MSEQTQEIMTSEMDTTKEVTLKEKKKKASTNEDLYFESEEQARHFEIKRKIRLGFVYFFLAIAALFTLIPFYYIIQRSRRINKNSCNIFC